MATKFLRKIILEELKKVLKEEMPPIGDPLRRSYQKLTPQEQSKVDVIINSSKGTVDMYTAIRNVNPSVLPPVPGAEPSDQQKLASMKKDLQSKALDWNKLAQLGIKALTDAAKVTPVGKLQAALAAKGHRISNIGNGKLVDGRVGPLTLAALQKETGKVYTAQQLYALSDQNPSAMNSLINAVSGETLRQIMDLEKDLQNMKAPQAPEAPQTPERPGTKEEHEFFDNLRKDPNPRVVEEPPISLGGKTTFDRSVGDNRSKVKVAGFNKDGKPVDEKGNVIPSNLDESLLKKQIARMLKNL